MLAETQPTIGEKSAKTGKSFDDSLEFEANGGRGLTTLFDDSHSQPRWKDRRGRRARREFLAANLEIGSELVRNGAAAQV